MRLIGVPEFFAIALIVLVFDLNTLEPDPKSVISIESLLRNKDFL